MNRHAPVLSCILIIGIASTLSALAADLTKLPEPAKQAGVSYAEHIKPLFDRSCVKCHGEEKQKAGLRLDNLEAALKGSKKGKVIVPGTSAESELVLSVAHATEDPDHWMPPEGKAEPLSKGEISLLRAWIDQGAK